MTAALPVDSLDACGQWAGKSFEPPLPTGCKRIPGMATLYRRDRAHDAMSREQGAGSEHPAEISDLTRQVDVRVNAVTRYFSGHVPEGLEWHWPQWTPEHKMVLWAIVAGCLSNPGQALAWSTIVVGQARREQFRAAVHHLITSGAAHLAGLIVDVSGFTPTFMAPIAVRKPR
jgi:hypothetical protein